MERFAAEGFTGTNVTSPFKDEVMEYVSLPDKISSLLGSANTIISANGKLHSYNTDYYGVKNTLEAFLPAAGHTEAPFCAPDGTLPQLGNTRGQFCAPNGTLPQLGNTRGQFCAPNGTLPQLGNTRGQFCTPNGTLPQLGNTRGQFCAPEDTLQQLGNTRGQFCAPEDTLPQLGNTRGQFCAPNGTLPQLGNIRGQFCAPEELTALVVGAGGAGKAAALAVKDMGMKVYFANRSSHAAKPFAEKIGAEYIPLDDIPLLLPKTHIIVYNLSMEIDPLKDISLEGKIVFEANYAHPNLNNKGAHIYIDGRYWLYNQAIPAFKLFTGEEPCTTAMAGVMGL